MKQILLMALVCAATHARAQTFLDFSTLFDTDAVLESGGAGLGFALDAEGRRLDAASLPAAYADGTPISAADGRATFRFGTLKQSSLDAVSVDGQLLDVADGRYAWLDVALLAAPGALGDPFSELEFRYADGATERKRLGPVPGWFNSPTAFDHTLYRYTDSSGVQTLASFRTDFGDAEANYLVEQRNNGNSGGNRFVDGTGYVVYRFGDLGELREAKLGVTVGNNFVISIATALHEPSFSTDGYTEVANSMVIYEGFEHRALGNLRQYDVDLAPFLAEGTGEIYVLLTDATTANGWGPYLQQILLYTGTPRTFDDVLAPVVDANGATVYAAFRAGTDEEKPYLFDNRGSGPSNRGHRFADAAGSITYRFDLPDDVTNPRLTMDLANNFVVGLSGASETVRYFNMAAATPEENAFLIDEGGSIAGGDFRFADGSAYMIYQFDLPDEVTAAFAKIHVGNQFVIEAAGPEGDFTVVKDWVAETGEEPRDNSNLDFYDVDLAPYLANNPSKVVRLRLSDGQPADGWGPFLRSIAIQNVADSGETQFTTVLESQSLFSDDIRTEYNKGYYTVDLASVLANNPKKEFFVQFTDGSVGDGWGPGIFWMAVYSGDLVIHSDQRVFENLKTTQGDPTNYGAGLLHRRYEVNSAKTLSSIALPEQAEGATDRVYLLAATLVASAAPPALEVSLTPAGNVRVSWPASATGYALRTAPSLATPSPWAAVTESPIEADGRWVVELPPADAFRCYRLESSLAGRF